MTELWEIDDARLPQLVALYRSTWWAGERTIEQAARIVANSNVVVGLVDDDRLVAFARALTDTVAAAIVFDVIVAPDLRGTGLGDELMRRLLARPEIARVCSVELVCQPDLVPFYERFGFTDAVGGSRLMRRTADPRLLAPDGVN